jgi:hypothetical protein
VPFLQGITGERMTGAPTLIGQDGDLVHQVRCRGQRRNGVSNLLDTLGDQPLDNLFKPAPQLLPQLRRAAARHGRGSNRRSPPKARICSGVPVAARSSSR